MRGKAQSGRMGAAETKGRAMERVAKKLAGAALALAVMAAGAGCGFTGVVEVDGERWETVFEDTSLGEAEAREIFEDYRFWAGRYGKIWRDPRWTGNPGSECRGGNGQYALAGCLHVNRDLCGRLVDGVFSLDERGILKEGERVPSEMEKFERLAKEFGWLVADGHGKEVLVVPRAVSDAYREGLALWKQHPGARESLEELLRAMGEGDTSYLPEKPLDMMTLYGFGERREAKIRKDYGTWREGEGNRGLSKEEVLAEWAKYDWLAGPLFTAGEFEGCLTVCVLQMRREKEHPWESDYFPWIFVFDGERWMLFVYEDMGGASC